MLKSFRGRIIVILAVLGLSAGYLWTRGLKLGLDLQGGIHLVLEIDDPDGTLTPERREDAIDRAERIIRTRVDEFGVEEPLIQKSGSDRIIVELAGLDDESRAKEIINQQAYLEWKLVLETTEVDPALERLDRAVVVAIGEEGLREMGRATEVAQAATSIEQLLFSDPEDTLAAGDSAAAAGDPAAADAPAAEDEAADTVEPEEEELNLRPFTGLLNRGEVGTYTVDAADVETASDFMALPEFQRALPRNVSLQWGWDSIPIGGRFYRELYVLEEEAFLTGDQLDDATANRDQQFNQPQVLFELNRRGGRAFQQLTGAHIGDRIAIVLDGEVVSAPFVRDRIGSRGSIDLGTADMSEATDLALVLRAGALPAPLRIMEERAVGPSLGQDSVDQGRIAGIVGIVLVIVVMILYYKVAGMLAITALGFYLVLVLGGLAALNATLTLPGIAGLILSIGMAVDANVLIFERIREELAARRAPRTAVDEGFGNALSAIVDANLTTLITGLILFQFGTGPVRGFAVTLCIGIVASFFSALYVTRTLFLMYLSGKRGSDPVSI
ncbi:MAG: protein translocase subunit SecD [Gemmatimonadetes bacterium]|nr:protein translocase subunit SecD [Gemmatimonadota bacterium]MYA43840.1 protein translocase subunit SecD [Gemmatimonadota bacterium]MYE92568.1 protein translocase subunit SecD [Gemmatimonadota bacterium]MYJ10968.1 protein translocase subunit SecD [Gemmatimonadota bacterium]